MPAPRQRPRDSVPPAIAVLCKALREVITRSGLTDKEALARTGLGISQTTLSRQLLGQVKSPPTPEVVAAFVRVTAAELGVEPASLYADYPALREHVQSTSGPISTVSSSASATTTPVLDAAATRRAAGWIWSLVTEKREEVAAVALHGLPHPQEVFRLLASADPGAAAALHREVVTACGPERAEVLLRSCKPDDRPILTATLSVLESVKSDRKADNELRDLFIRSPGRQLMGRRLALLAAQKGQRRVCHEIIALADHTSAEDAATVLDGLVSATGQRTVATTLDMLGDIRADVLHDILAAYVLDRGRRVAGIWKDDNIIAALESSTVARMIAAIADPHWAVHPMRPDPKETLRQVMSAATLGQVVSAVLPFAGQPESAVLFESLPNSSLRHSRAEIFESMTRVNSAATVAFIVAAVTHAERYSRTAHSVAEVLSGSRSTGLLEQLIETDPAVAAQVLLAMTEWPSRKNTITSQTSIQKGIRALSGPSIVRCIFAAPSGPDRARLLAWLLTDVEVSSTLIWNAFVQSGPASQATEVLVDTMHESVTATEKLGGAIIRLSGDAAWTRIRQAVADGDRLSIARDIIGEALIATPAPRLRFLRRTTD